MRERGLTGVDGRRELEQEVLVLEVRPRARDERRAERAGRREHRNRKRKDRARLSRQANLPPQLGDRYHSAAPPTRSRYRHRNTDQHTTDALHHLVQLCPGPGAGQRESPAPPLPRTAEKSARNRRAPRGPAPSQSAISKQLCGLARRGTRGAPPHAPRCAATDARGRPASPPTPNFADPPPLRPAALNQACIDANDLEALRPALRSSSS